MTQADLPRRPTSGVRFTSRWTGLATVAAVAIFLAIVVPRALGAVSDAEELTRFGSAGTAAGQLELTPGRIATDPLTGHVYASENDHRVSEFTPWGGFVKAFGWDVAPGAVNEQQEVRVSAAAGQFKLTFHAESTSDLAFDAGAGEVQTALDALASIGAGAVSVREVAGALDGSTPIVYVIAFDGPALKGSDVEQLGAVDGTTPLSGGIPSSGVLVRTRADGHAASAGLESCTAESGCQAGLAGAGAGELQSPTGIAVDANGNVYVMDTADHRLQKFDSAGRFVLMAGGEVDKTTHANLCTAASGDECGIGVTGTGDGQFNAQGGGGVALCPASALCPSGALFVNDHDRIQRFSLQGEYESQLLVGAGNLQQLAFDPTSTDLYATFGEREDVHKLSATTGEEVAPSLKVNAAGAVAADSAGDVFAPDGIQHLVLEFDSAGKPLSPSSCCAPPPRQFVSEPFSIEALATNAIGDLYVGNARVGVDSFIRSFGPAPASFEAPPKVPPTIESQYAVSSDLDSAVLRAQINPHFWSNTTYYVQYGTADCEVSPCASQPSQPGSRLTAHVLAAPVTSGDVALSGLQPGTTYHYRFVSESGGGGPVFGPDHTFNTFAASSVKTDCPNQTFRTGFSALLADCRAYEMVSPIDKNNGDIVALIDSQSSTALDQSAASGEKMTYSSYRSFGAPEAAPYTNQYIAYRHPAGWVSEAIDPAQDSTGAIGSNLENPYKAFTEDLCKGWLVGAVEPPLAPGATVGYHDLYRRDNCGAEGYETLTDVAPSVEPEGFYPELQSVSADGRQAIVKQAILGPGNLQRAYYASAGALDLLCVLPNGAPSPGNCSGGTGSGGFASGTLSALYRQGSFSHAISQDGSRAYWTDSGPITSGQGTVYLRENPGRPESAAKDGEGNCLPEAERACTVRVSGTVTSKAADFLGATPDGSRALFEVAEGAQAANIYEFDAESGESTLIATKAGEPSTAELFTGLVGASEDLSHIYFVSSEASPEEISEGAAKGEANLYLSTEGTVKFIATLAQTDAFNGEAISDTSAQPILHAARTTADGGTLAFVSTAPLTGYDNLDQTTGEADSEVYVYAAGAQSPLCVSCNPSGARPRGRAVRGGPTAAVIPAATSDLYTPRALSGDGRRLFFDSYDALLPRDTNGKEDVYEWEASSGSADCAEKGAELYVASAEGCLSLISSGESPEDSEFLDADPSGENAFFTTSTSLLPQDPGLIDVYDARVGGGFPQSTRPAVCEGEACQGSPLPPVDSTPASLVFSGPGNLAPLLSAPKPTVKPPLKRCRKGMVRKKGRCVKEKRSVHKGSAKSRKAGKSSRSALRRDGRTGR